MSAPYRLLGSVLSPFAAKTRFGCEVARLPLRVLPDEGTRLEALAAWSRRTAMTRGVLAPSEGPLDPLSELPLVPYLFGPRGERWVDSTAILRRLDAEEVVPLLPARAPARFACSLLDELFDEVGLYLLHHQRWVRSARSNRAAEIVAHEFRALVPRPVRDRVAAGFAARQVRRLPYLFSVADAGDRSWSDLPAERRPPSRAGFPPTHALLDRLFERMLDGLERVLRTRAFLFGEAPSLADCAGAGIVASHLVCDPETAAAIRVRAPATAAWAERFLERRAGGERAPLDREDGLEPLLELAGDVLVPLLRANERAYLAHGGGDRTRHNERAFERGSSLYSLELAGTPVRHVVKTFQVRVWRELCAELGRLDARDRAEVIERVPALGEPR